MGTDWPSQVDYIEAMQDPPSAFIDPSLRAGTVESDSVLNLPKPRSGQMASVYKVFDGPKTWAVRCFNFASDERAERYRAISNFLADNANRYTVDFAYVRDGIIVASQPYPILKMEWVEGDLLHTYIAKHLDAPGALAELARAWVEMVRDLHAIQMAHGDLQHGNVLVTPGGDLKLIDYDGMFVPEFAGSPSLEDGHPNYQHPCRQSCNFGPRLDNFSAWIIYLSISAVMRDRTLWETLRFGDDCLALRRTDFARPSTSAAFARLESADDPEVRKIAMFVRSMLSHEPEDLPALESGARILFAPGAEQRPGRPSWRFAPFENQPLAVGAYIEPYEPRPIEIHAPEPPSPRPVIKQQHLLARAGGGLAATVAGCWVFREYGFPIEQVVVIISLGWALAGILAFASRSIRPPGAPPG